jgi:prefoldin beta subunit
VLHVQQEDFRGHDGQARALPVLRKQGLVQVAFREHESASGLRILFMDIPNEAQESISKLQLIEQNMQALLMQKQQFQAQLFEAESALKELEKTDEAYKIVGNVMIKSDKTALKAELSSRKELVDLRLKNIDKQEKQLKEKAEALQKEVMSKLKK